MQGNHRCFRHLFSLVRLETLLSTYLFALDLGLIFSFGSRGS